MVQDLDAILAILDKLIVKFSPTMVEDLDAILAILDKLSASDRHLVDLVVVKSGNFEKNGQGKSRNFICKNHWASCL